MKKTSTMKKASRMKKVIPVGLMLLGPVFVAAGIYTVSRGLDAREQVRDELVAQNITTPDDARIPDTPVRDAGTAAAMADIVDVHARETTGGLSFAEMGRFKAENGDPAGTSIEDEAVVGPDGEPVRNPLRNVAFEASAVRTGLYTSVMALNLSDLVVGLGVMMLALGLAVGGVGVVLGEPALPRLNRRVPVVPLGAAPVA